MPFQCILCKIAEKAELASKKYRHEDPLLEELLTLARAALVSHVLNHEQRLDCESCKARRA